MKIAILNDTHAGVRGDMLEMAKYQGRFYEEVFFPYLDENNMNIKATAAAMGSQLGTHGFVPDDLVIQSEEAAL